MPETRLVIPLDGSPMAETALSALEAVRALGPLRILLVSVVEAVDGLSQVANDEYLKREDHLMRAYLDGVEAKLKSQPWIASVESRLMAGNPADLIVAQAKDFSADIIIINTHGRSGFSRWRLGSVADAVIRTATTNTLVVGPNSRLRAPVQEIMVGLDGSVVAEGALPVATALATGLNATLHLVQVVDLPVSTSESYQASIDMLQEFAESYLGKVQAGLSFPGKILTAARIGRPAERLADYAASNDIRLVVMTSHGRGGIMRGLLGSVTGRLVGGPAPVLVVRTR